MDDEREAESRNAARPGAEAVLSILRRLDPPPPGLHDGLARDPEALAEILFDCAKRLEGRMLLQCMADLLRPGLTRLALGVCGEECWFLDPARLCDDAIARLYAELIHGRRIKPWAAWAWKVLGEATRLGIDDPALSLFQPDELNSPKSRMTAELARLCNHLPYSHRRVAWLKWVHLASDAEIASKMSMELERVEVILSRVLDEAISIVLRMEMGLDEDDGGSWDSEGPRDPWEKDDGS